LARKSNARLLEFKEAEAAAQAAMESAKKFLRETPCARRDSNPLSTEPAAWKAESEAEANVEVATEMKEELKVEMKTEMIAEGKAEVKTAHLQKRALPKPPLTAASFPRPVAVVSPGGDGLGGAFFITQMDIHEEDQKQEGGGDDAMSLPDSKETSKVAPPLVAQARAWERDLAGLSVAGHPPKNKLVGRARKGGWGLGSAGGAVYERSSPL
jgi:hypothetical protein